MSTVHNENLDHVTSSPCRLQRYRANTHQPARYLYYKTSIAVIFSLSLSKKTRLQRNKCDETFSDAGGSIWLSSRKEACQIGIRCETFSNRRLTCSVQAIEAALPIYREEWEPITCTHTAKCFEEIRASNLLRRKFCLLYRSRMPTEDDTDYNAIFPATIKKTKLMNKRLAEMFQVKVELVVNMIVQGKEPQNFLANYLFLSSI